MARPVIALLSDFGLRDHYVGAMKAVVLDVCPDATLVDITHDVPAHDVTAGALELAASYRFFPKGTVFLVVVDPGVGSKRRGLAVDTGEHRFVAPDNGILSPIVGESGAKRIVQLTARRYARASVSRTFEGRDRFAPAAGWLAKGIELGALGRAVSDYVRLDLPRPVMAEGTLTGEVTRVDRFGNLVTNIDRSSFEAMTASGAIEITIGDHPVPKFVNTYAEVETGEICALFGSSDYVEIASNSGNAAERLSLGRGAVVTVLQAEPSA